MRDQVLWPAIDCKRRNYITKKNKRLHPDRVEYRKYCSFCPEAHGAQRDAVGQ